MKMRHRKWLIAVLAAAALCLLGIAPESAYAATGHAASTPASASIAKQAAVTPAEETICSAHADIEPTGNWEAIIGDAVFNGCTGDGPTPVDCHTQAVIQGQSGLTSGWTDLLEAPSEPGCAGGEVSIGTLPCPTTAGSIVWNYRTEVLSSAHFDNGTTGTGVGYSVTISSYYQCDILA